MYQIKKTALIVGLGLFSMSPVYAGKIDKGLTILGAAADIKELWPENGGGGESRGGSNIGALLLDQNVTIQGSTIIDGTLDLNSIEVDESNILVMIGDQTVRLDGTTVDNSDVIANSIVISTSNMALVGISQLFEMLGSTVTDSFIRANVVGIR